MITRDVTAGQFSEDMQNKFQDFISYTKRNRELDDGVPCPEHMPFGNWVEEFLYWIENKMRYDIPERKYK